MEGFHNACTSLAVLGKRFGDAGLSDLFFESGIFSSGSISAALDGHQCNRGLHIHMIMQEALLQVQWGQVTQWLASQLGYKEDPGLVTAIRKLRDCVTLQGVKDFLALPEMQQLHQFYLDFCREDRGHMAAY